MQRLYYEDLRPFTEGGRTLILSKKSILKRYEVFCLAQSYMSAGIPFQSGKGWKSWRWAKDSFQRYYCRVMRVRKVCALDLKDELQSLGLIRTFDGLWWSPYQLGDLEEVGFGVIDSELGGGTCSSGAEFYAYDILLVEIPVKYSGEEIW